MTSHWQTEHFLHHHHQPTTYQLFFFCFLFFFFEGLFWLCRVFSSSPSLCCWFNRSEELDWRGGGILQVFFVCGFFFWFWFSFGLVWFWFGLVNSFWVRAFTMRLGRRLTDLGLTWSSQRSWSRDLDDKFIVSFIPSFGHLPLLLPSPGPCCACCLLPGPP